MKRLLYIDVPFEGIKGGDKNRSRFIWSVLSNEFDADLLLIKTDEYLSKQIPNHYGYDQIYTLTAMHNRFYYPESIYNFNKDQLQQFTQILDLHRYEFVVLRFLSCFNLAKVVATQLPDCKIAIDVDMLFSRVAEMSWEQDKSIKNRYYYFEKYKLSIFERFALKKDFIYFFTNKYELELVINKYQPSGDTKRFKLLPNMLPEFSGENDNSRNQLIEDKKYILFFGTLNSASNIDAFKFLASEIYPKIARVLHENDVNIYIIGKNPDPIINQYCGGRIKLIGNVDNLNQFIKGSLFVLLPLRIASGTRTRILESAILKKAVITTTVGAEGLDFDSTEIIIEDSIEKIAYEVERLIHHPSVADIMGQKIYDKAIQLYSRSMIGQQLVSALTESYQTMQNSQNQKLKIAIVTNRFYPEVGGAETNIYYQALELSKYYQVTVFCPKRINKPSIEDVEGFRIYRMFDLFNVMNHFPNIKAKTLCPELLIHLLFTNYDIVQCFPAINYNNIIAFIAAKLTFKPFILCSFDFLDYAKLIKENESIDQDILDKYPVKWYQNIFIRGCNHIFAISEKEIKLFRKYNNNVDYSPVPILQDEYLNVKFNPRSKFNLDNNFIFLCLGRISHIKGQDLALQAFKVVRKNLLGAKLVFVGRTDYEPEFYTHMQIEVEREKLTEDVIFTGVLERDEVLGWLKYSDIHVIPVRFMNSGAVVVESWISDTAVIQSDVVDPNLVIDGRNGYCFKSENIEDLALKMQVAYNNKDTLNELAANGKALVLEKYTYEYLINLYTKIYLQLT